MAMHYTERTSFNAFFERCMDQTKVIDKETGKLRERRTYPLTKNQELLERLRKHNRRNK
tara:strand:+ start:1385 stop:1561 length:177 start_codon:yes stop_codon:yes gene_type:complete